MPVLSVLPVWQVLYNRCDFSFIDVVIYPATILFSFLIMLLFLLYYSPRRNVLLCIVF